MLRVKGTKLKKRKRSMSVSENATMQLRTICICEIHPLYVIREVRENLSKPVKNYLNQ